MNPSTETPRPGGDSFLPLLLAFLVGGGALLFLILVSGGFFLYVVAAAFGIAAVGYLHYLLWGASDTPQVAGPGAAAEPPAPRGAKNGPVIPQQRGL
jgi:hypothetical protein